MAAKPVKYSPGKISYWAKKGVTGTKNITAARNKQIAENDPNAFGPGANLSPKQLGSQVQADATLQYGQQYAQIGQQYGQVDPIYDAYRKSITDLQAQAKSASDQATADISSRAAALAAADHADNAQMFADLAKDAASRGATTDPSLQATAQQASASRQASAGSDANLQTTLGANQQNFLGGQAALGEGARLNRKQTLANDMNTLVGQVGAFKVQDRAKIIAAAQAAGINLSQLGVAQQNADTAAGLAGVTAGKAKSDAAAKRALARNNKAKLNLSAGKISHDQMLADKKFQLDQQKFGAAQAKTLYQERHQTGFAKPGKTGGGKSTTLTPTQARAYHVKVDQAMALLPKFAPNKKPLPVTANDPVAQQQAVNALVSEQAIPHGLARAIVDQYVNGGVSKHTAQVVAQHYGVHLKVINVTPINKR